MIPISTAGEFETWLAKPPADKAGEIAELAANLDLRGVDRALWEDAFTYVPGREWATVRSADPAQPALVGQIHGQIQFSDRGAVKWGGLTLKDLQFDMGGSTFLAAGQIGQNTDKIAIDIDRLAEAKGVSVIDCAFIGDLKDPRAENIEAEEQLTAIFATCDDLTVEGCYFEKLNTACNVAAWSSGITIRRNLERHAWEDFVSLGGGKSTGGGPVTTSNIVIEENVVVEKWSNRRRHPDGVHINNWQSSDGDSIIDGLVIRRNIFGDSDPYGFPAFPTGYSIPHIVHETPPASVAFTDRQAYRIKGTGTVQVTGSAAALNDEICIQLEVGQVGAQTLTIEPGPGVTFLLNGVPTSSIQLTAPGQTLQLLAKNAGNLSEFEAEFKPPSSQPLFANTDTEGPMLANPIITENIVITAAGKGINMADMTNGSVTRNTFLSLWPGDSDGDGTANTIADAVDASSPRAVIAAPSAGSTATFDRNIRGTGGSGLTETNSVALAVDGSDHVAAFTTTVSGDGFRFMPQTGSEILAAAKPRADGTLAATTAGAILPDGSDDANWTWVAALEAKWLP